MKLIVYRSRGRQKWRWHVVGANGRKVANSGEAYANRQDCIDIARKLFPALPVEFHNGA